MVVLPRSRPMFFDKIEFWMPRKLAKTMRIFVKIEHIENQGVTFWPERIVPVFYTLWSGHEFSHGFVSATKVHSSLISLLLSLWTFFCKLVATVELTLCPADIFILQEIFIWFVQPQIGHTCYWHPYSTSEAACRYKHCLSLCLWRCQESGVV